MPVVMAADQVARNITRIAHEIVERKRTLDDLALVGIRTRGVPIARRLSAGLYDIAGATVPTGVLDITLYRDDLMSYGRPRSSSRSTTAGFCSSTTCCTPVARFARRSMRSSTLVAPDPSSSSSSWTADTANSRSRLTMSARTCRRRCVRASGFGWTRSTGWTRWC